MNFTEMVLKAGFVIRDMDVIAPHSCSLTQALMRFRGIVERNAVADIPDGRLKIRMLYKQDGKVAMHDQYIWREAIDGTDVNLVGGCATEGWQKIKRMVDGAE